MNPTRKRTWEEVLDYIQDNSYLDEQTNCFIWLRGVTGNGYGSIKFQDQIWSVHRLVYLRLVCDVPPESVMHKCDNKRCWNPEHLIGGSTADNMQDKVDKGRQAKGAMHGRAKLDDGKVRCIRMSDKSISALAEEYSVTKRTIRFVKEGLTWTHV